jgi:hypothetical protein
MYTNWDEFGGHAMEIKALDQIIEVQALDDLNDQIFQTVRGVIDNKDDLSFSHLVVDGMELYIEDFQQLELDRESKLVEIVFRDKSTWIVELAASTTQYINDAIPAVEQLAMNFYKTPEQESWNRLTELFEAVDLLNNMLVNFGEISKEHNVEAETVIKTLFDQMEELHGALSKHDYILVGDLLKYELIELLQSIRNVANKISGEVAAHDKN